MTPSSRCARGRLFSLVLLMAACTVVDPGIVASDGMAVDESGIQARRIEPGRIEVRIPLSERFLLPRNMQVWSAISTLDGRTLGEARVAEAVLTGRDFVLRIGADAASLDHPGNLLLKYRIEAKGQVVAGRLSLARAMGVLSTSVLGGDTLLAGKEAGLRVICREMFSGRSVQGARVRVDLAQGEHTARLFDGKTDRHGTASLTFHVPEGFEGQATLKVAVDSDLGTDEVVRAVNVADRARVMLTTDKPLYQPGQTIHIRALALHAPDRRAAANREAVIEVEDSKGNKVFKKTGKTDGFGLLAADFVLADELNQGDYTVRAVVGEDRAEKSVNVSRYVLPKFKVDLTTEAAYFLPGDKLKGTIRADYFFGKPVAGARVRLEASRFDVAFETFAKVEGKTDAQGRFDFELAVPSFFVGQPLLAGKALVRLDVSVVDTAEHEEKKTATRPVAQAPLTVVAVPESGKLVPEIANTIYLAFAYPDGSPAKGVVVQPPLGTGGPLLTDAIGIASFEAVPGREGLSFTIDAADREGRRVQQAMSLPVEAGEEQILLRTDRALYRVGEQATLTAFTNVRSARTVYFDVIREGLPVFVTAADLDGGKAEARVALSDDFAGTVQFRAYVIGRTTDIRSDAKVSYVHPAQDLIVRIRPDKETHRPGEGARVDFTVTDTADHPVLAALGISIVDESVFALQDNQPGLEKVFFMIERELMTPRWEAHEYGADAIVNARTDAKADRAYRVLLASIEEIPGYPLQENTAAGKNQEALQAAWQVVFADQQAIQQALQAFYNKKKRYPSVTEGLGILVAEKLLSADHLIDPWGNPYAVNKEYPIDPISYVMLASRGPDEVEGTPDDLSGAYMYTGRRGGGGWWGRFKGAVMGGAEMFDMAVPMAAAPAREEGVMMERQAKSREPMEQTSNTVSEADKAGVRVRERFPETLLFRPALITGTDGRASLSFDMADSITTWRLAATASTAGGLLGSAAAPLRVFQDFFVDIDFPVALTQGDQVSVPVAVYNYLNKAQTVRIQAEPADWYSLLDGQSVKELRIGPGEVSVVRFPIRAEKIGRFDFTVYGIGSALRDAIKREIEVRPDGQEHLVSESGRITDIFRAKIPIPELAIDGASKVWVKVYPGLLSQVLEGLDNIFRMPSGCFEQTSSTTYPNIIVLDYMKTAGTVSPEVRMKAEAYINQGYQRLLSFEVPGGGFEWFGNAPAHKILTAYGLMEFADMSRVHNVDPNVIARTQAWLRAQQEKDGSWKPSERFLDTVASKFQSDVLRNTAYIAWALASTGDKGDATQKGLAYLARNLGQARDAYTVALVANAFASADPKSKETAAAVKALLALAKEDGDKVFWQTDGPTPTMARGESADVETTGLAAQALIRADAAPGVVNRVLAFLISSKDAYGTWHSTQATVYAIKALTLAMARAASGIDGEVTVRINGKEAAHFAITPADSDVLRLIDLKEQTREGSNDVEVVFAGKGSAMVQVVGRYYLPWAAEPKVQAEPIGIDVSYDRKELETGGTVKATVTVTNRRPGRFGMVVVDLGVPPGFEVESGDLAELVGQKTIQKYTVTGRQVIVYLDQVVQGKPVTFSYRLKAKYPIRAQAPVARAYEYYNPAVEAFSKPVALVVN